MKRKFTLKTLLMMAAMMLPSAVFAGNGTKESPYTVAELNAQKEALAASGDTVWVKADLKGLGTDGTATTNIDNNCAGLFADATDSFVAYSWHLLGQLAMEDLTNTKDLLISLNYGTAGRQYGNSSYPEYADSKEPTDAHFSIGEIHGALTVTVSNGKVGFHSPCTVVIPENMVFIKVSAGYSMSKGAYLNCENVYDGKEKTYATPKDCAFVVLAEDGDHDIVLNANYLYEQPMSNGNSMTGGTQAGLNTYSNSNTYCYRFIATADKVGFERNSDNTAEVTLDSKREIYLHVSSKDTNFFGYWNWETADKKWISWNGKSYSDYRGASGIQTVGISTRPTADNKYYDLQGRPVSSTPQKGLYIINGKKHIVK